MPGIEGILETVSGLRDQAGDSTSPIGTVLSKIKSSGSLVGTVVGAGQLAAGLIKRGSANKDIPNREDPELNNLITDIRRKTRAFETGTSSETARAAVLGTAKVGANAVFSSGRGMRGGLNFLASKANQGIIALNQQDINASLALENLNANVTQAKVQRKTDISMLHHLEKKAIAENRVKAGGANLMAGVANMLGTDPSSVVPVDNVPDTTDTTGGDKEIDLDLSKSVFNNLLNGQ